jgi:hypothetical protein
MSLHAMQVNQVGDENVSCQVALRFLFTESILAEISFTLGMKPKGLQQSLGSGLL